MFQATRDPGIPSKVADRCGMRIRRFLDCREGVTRDASAAGISEQYPRRDPSLTLLARDGDPNRIGAFAGCSRWWDSMIRVLLTTVHRDVGLYDYFRENAPEGFAWRFRMPRRISCGLRFLRQNIPGIEILEYPTHAEYRRALGRRGDGGGHLFYVEEADRIV